MHALTHTLWNAGFLAHFERNPIQAEHCASELIELSTRQNFASWLAGGIVWIEHGIENMRAAGWVLCLPYALSIKAEVLHLADRASEALEILREAEALAKTRSERWWWAELHRLRGVFLGAIGTNEAQIEASFSAIHTAKERKSISPSETCGSNLRTIPPPKSKRVRRTSIPAASLLTPKGKCQKSK